MVTIINTNSKDKFVLFRWAIALFVATFCAVLMSFLLAWFSPGTDELFAWQGMITCVIFTGIFISLAPKHKQALYILFGLIFLVFVSRVMTGSVAIGNMVFTLRPVILSVSETTSGGISGGGDGRAAQSKYGIDRNDSVDVNALKIVLQDYDSNGVKVHISSVDNYSESSSISSAKIEPTTVEIPFGKSYMFTPKYDCDDCILTHYNLEFEKR